MQERWEGNFSDWRCSLCMYVHQTVVVGLKLLACSPRTGNDGETQLKPGYCNTACVAGLFAFANVSVLYFIQTPVFFSSCVYVIVKTLV